MSPSWLLAAIVTSVVAAAPQQPSSGLIVGRVIDGTTGAIVTNATVTISGPSAPRTGNVVLVDSQGRFMFTELPAGSYTIVAHKNGYLTGAFGRTLPQGMTQPLVLRQDERVVDATIRLWRFSSVSGRVVDEAGEPVPGIRVMSLQRTWLAGRPKLSTTGSGNDRTDDRGEFRLFQMTPGEYVIAVFSRQVTFPIGYVESDAAATQTGGELLQNRAAELAAKGANRLGSHPGASASRIGDFVLDRPDSPDTPIPSSGERLLVFPLTFHPNATSADLATPVVVTAGEQLTGVNLQLRLTPTVRVSGSATGPDGPIENLGLRLQLGSDSQFRSRGLIEPAQTVTGPGGTFTFLGVPAGTFTIVGAWTPGEGGALSAALPVTVADKDLENIALALRPNARLSGRVVFEGASDKPPVRLVGQLLGIDPADGTSERVMFQVSPEGAITPTSIPPGRYFLRIGTSGGPLSGLGGWTLKSAVVGGRDVSDVPLVVAGTDVNDLVVTLTDSASTLTGFVRSAQAVPDPAAVVLVFPVDRGLWIDFGSSPRRLRAARPDRNGVFSVTGLPAGEYFALALPQDATDQWMRQTFLSRASSMATRFKVGNGSSTLDLVTRRWPQ